MIELLTDPAAWASLLTLTALEIVLGIDNVIFLSIIASRLPAAQQPAARRIGLGLALAGRLILLAGIAWIIGLTQPMFEAWGFALSWRDAILIAGGLFLLAKATVEIHHTIEPDDKAASGGKAGLATASFSGVLVQIFLIDLVFSLDSILTAVGMTPHIPIMVAAICIAIGVMLFAAELVSTFVQRHPTVKMLALSFLLLIGMTLIADGLHFHVPRGYIYFAVAFSVGVEALNLWRMRRRAAQRATR